MIAVVTILAAFPLGFFLRSRLAANTTYAIAYLWAFVFQTLYLTAGLHQREQRTRPSSRASSRCPTASSRCAIFLVGFGLVQLGHRVGRGRRERRQESSRSSLTGTIASAASGNTAASANVAG